VLSDKSLSLHLKQMPTGAVGLKNKTRNYTKQMASSTIKNIPVTHVDLSLTTNNNITAQFKNKFSDNYTSFDAKNLASISVIKHVQRISEVRTAK